MAGQLVALGVRPDHVSAASTVFAALTGIAWLSGARAQAAGAIAPAISLWVLGAIAIQLRLLCNLLDGLMAIEGGGARSALGELWNDVPDRVSDALVLIAAGHAVSGGWQVAGWSGWEIAGWSAAMLAVGTAYVRFVGASLLGHHDFGGPLAKPQRMFVMTVAGVAAAIEIAAGEPARAVPIGLVVVAAGSALTLVLRLARIARELRARGPRP